MTTPTDPAKKPGWKTSEFYIAILTPILGLLVTTGVLTGEQSVVIQNQTTQIIEAVFSLVAVAAPAVAYIWSRAKVKTRDKV